MQAGRLRRVGVLLAVLVAAAACSVNPRDASQEPRIAVRVDSAGVHIMWQPEGAQLVRVYRGARAGDGYGDSLMWSVAANTKNSLRSGLMYGELPTGGMTDVPAKPLVYFRTYTIEVTRADPKASGDGFTGTSNRYVGTSQLRYLQIFP